LGRVTQGLGERTIDDPLRLSIIHHYRKVDIVHRFKTSEQHQNPDEDKND
jgi:hypothetical protein